MQHYLNVSPEFPNSFYSIHTWEASLLTIALVVHSCAPHMVPVSEMGSPLWCVHEHLSCKVEHGCSEE